MTNANPIINLRNKAIIWLSIAIVAFVGSWLIYGFFNGVNSSVIGRIEELTTTLNLIQKEGVITTKNWDELTSEEKKNERWTTMTRLAPVLQKLTGIGTPTAGKNIITMKNISNKVGNEDYIPWLEKSWTPDAETALDKTQGDIAEVIPVFAGVSELASTQNVAGKITLKSLNDYIQINIVDRFNLSNAFGQIGINRVRFLKDAPEVGVYDIPLRFERVPNDNIINLLQFLGKTGGIKITETGKAIMIEHTTPQPIKTDNGQSTLKNLLITVKDMSITPSKTDNADVRSNITTKTRGMWDVNMTLQFYIRGVSRDYIASLDGTITSLLSKTSKDSLVVQGNTLLKQCNGCAATSQIRDILSLLTQAQDAYTSIGIEERDQKKGYTPLDILEHRTRLMTTLETLQKKLTNIASLISPN